MYAYLAVAILAAALSFAGTWRVQEWRHAAIEKQRIEAQAEKQRMDAKRIDTAAVAHEKDKTRIRTEYVVITEKVNEAIATDFYAAGAPACLNPDGVRLVNESATGPAKPASQPASTVRGLKPSAWWKPSRSASVDD